MSDLKTITLKGVEGWREYDFAGRIYRIEDPLDVSFREGGSTHRIRDQKGVVHVVPAPGFNGCVLRFEGEIVA